MRLGAIWPPASGAARLLAGARVLVAALTSVMALSGAGRAQDGEWNAASEYYGAQEMAAAKRRFQEGAGGGTNLFLRTDRLEYQSNEGAALLLWDGEGWIGGDINKIWIKTEGEYDFDAHAFEHAEVQALYSRAISPFFDLQAGVRHDIKPDPSNTYGVLGLQGLAPYWFEIDAAAFISDDGDVSARIEAEYELMMTQRLILQPRTEWIITLQDSPEIGVGSGLSKVEAGLRLRYEFDRQFAPYIGLSWSRKLGDTADFARAAGEDAGRISFVTGLRLWF